MPLGLSHTEAALHPGYLVHSDFYLQAPLMHPIWEAADSWLH